jgi:hypothetical protein
MSFPLGGMLKLGIGYISNIIETVAPDELTGNGRANVQKTVGILYAAVKNIGPDYVASTENDLDDAIMDEVIDVCESAAVKYGLELDPQEL